MTLYQNRNLIEDKLKELIPEQIAECKECDALPPAMEELIIHNFQAKYVCYTKAEGMIEVGIEEMEATDVYPQIKTYTFPLEQAEKWLAKTLKTEEQDLKFYAKLLASNGFSDRIDRVILV